MDVMANCSVEDVRCRSASWCGKSEAEKSSVLTEPVSYCFVTDVSGLTSIEMGHLRFAWLWVLDAGFGSWRGESADWERLFAVWILGEVDIRLPS